MDGPTPGYVAMGGGGGRVLRACCSCALTPVPRRCVPHGCQARFAMGAAPGRRRVPSAQLQVVAQVVKAGAPARKDGFPTFEEWKARHVRQDGASAVAEVRAVV